MTDAINQPGVRKYQRKETNTADLETGQLPDVDMSLEAKIIHGESIPLLSPDEMAKEEYLKQLAFNEEPVTILINQNARSDYPETHVPVQVNGKGAEVLMNGNWVAMTYLPMDTELTTKRKYVEVLVRSKSVTIATKHDDATVERPHNTQVRRTSSNYPVSVLKDDNPRGGAWLSKLQQNH